MLITEVRIKLADRYDCNNGVLCYASITFDDSLTIHDMRLLQGDTRRFVSMPSRKLTDRCPHCGLKNSLQARFCNKCGNHFRPATIPTNRRTGLPKLFTDVAHPIDNLMRERIEVAVNTHYELELERSRQPGYVPSYSIGELDNVA